MNSRYVCTKKRGSYQCLIRKNRMSKLNAVEVLSINAEKILLNICKFYHRMTQKQMIYTQSHTSRPRDGRLRLAGGARKVIIGDLKLKRQQDGEAVSSLSVERYYHTEKSLGIVIKQISGKSRENVIVMWKSSAHVEEWNVSC